MEHREAKRQNVARQYMAGRLSTIEREDFEQHYFDCAECAEAVRLMVLDRTYPEERAAPPKQAWPEWLRSFWTWKPAAAQLLVPACIALLFTSYHAVTARGRLDAQAVETLHLAPDARGAGQSVAQRAGDFVVLTADVPEIAGQWKWRIRSAERSDFAMEGVVISAPGGVVNLLIPVGRFTPGRYILSVQDAASVAPELTYRFRML